MHGSHLGATPRLPSAHGAPPFHGRGHERSKPPGCGCPGPRGGQGRAKPGVPGEQDVCSVSEGFTEGSPRAPPPRAVSPGHTASSLWQPQAASRVRGPSWQSCADRRRGLTHETDREQDVCLPERGFPASAVTAVPPLHRGGGLHGAHLDSTAAQPRLPTRRTRPNPE